LCLQPFKSKLYYVKHKGYTITELAIVISIIAILVTLVVVTYNGLKVLANDSVAKVDLSFNVKKMSLNIIANGKLPTGDQSASSSDYKVRLSKRSPYKFYGYCTASDTWGGPLTEVVRVAGTADGHMYMYSTESDYVKDVSQDFGVPSTYTGPNTSSAGNPYKCWDYIKPGRTGNEFRDMVHWDGGVETGYVDIVNP
jgi:prepilin-type N-terminal cleavage/methylation domain-containing protein